MNAPAQTQKRRGAPIKVKERDAIIAALQADPHDIEGVAAKFNRGISTILKLRQRGRATRVTRRDDLRANTFG